jgi:hypothetical protein
MNPNDQKVQQPETVREWFLIRNAPKINATEVTYELHSLGWKAFQNLCVTIVSDICAKGWGGWGTTFNC